MYTGKEKVIEMPVTDFAEEESRSSYFRENFNLTDNLMRVIRKEEEEMSAEEKQQAQEKRWTEAQEIIARCQQEAGAVYCVPDKDHVASFHLLADAAEVIAERCGLDVATRITAQGVGFIKFTFDRMILTDQLPDQELKMLFGTLVVSCSTMHIGSAAAEDVESYRDMKELDPELQIAVIEFTFDLYREIHKGV